MRGSRDRGSVRGRRLGLALVLTLALAPALAGSLVGCADAPRTATARKAQLHPPVIGTAGVLRVAVDAAYPPFASKDASAYVGLDVDVASALAEQLGLRVEFVDASVGSLPAVLREKRADVALGGVPMTDAALSEITVATSYLADGPALFSRETSASRQDLEGMRIAVQKDSHAYWVLRAKVGEEHLAVTRTLREALDRAAAGDVDAAAGDALVGGYILREYQTLRMTRQVEDGAPLAVMVPKDAEGLETGVREAMDALAAGGVLDAIRGKWVGGLPPLRLAASQEPSALDTASSDAPLDSSAASTP